MSYNSRTNAYRSSNSVIISGPGTMYNEVTKPKSKSKQYNENTNTHDVTVPYISKAPYKVKTGKRSKGPKSKVRKNKLE